MLGLPCLVDVAIGVVVPPSVDAILHPATMVMAYTSHKIQHHPLGLSVSFVERSDTLLLGATNALIQH
jgi:hypothetical protein